MKLRIDKQVIVQALRTEPLTARKFGVRNADGCAYCAVGAALRAAGMPEAREQRASWNGSVFEADDVYNRVGCEVTASCLAPDDRAPPGNWLSALSIVWEYLNDDPEDGAEPEDLRPDILAWAEDNIPEDWEVTIRV